VSAAVEEKREAETAFPERDKLTGARDRYKELSTEVSVLEAKLARLERDESEVLGDVSADEETQCKRLAEVRIRKDVQARRTSHKRLELSRMLAEFEESYKPAEVELSTAQSLELTRRQEVLFERANAVLALTSEDWEAKSFLFRAVGGSPLLAAIRACSPNPNAHSVSIEQRAEELLAKFEGLEAEIGKEI
jgi:outer membrane murein-binding lipoprotein Lpp